MLRRLVLLSFSLMAAFNLTALSQAPPIEPGVSHDLAIWRAAHYSDIRYKLNLTLEKMSPVLKGTIEIRVKVANGSEPPASAGGQSASSAVPPIILDWRKIAGHEKDSSIANVSLNGQPVPISANWPPADAGCSDFADHLVFRDGVVAGENVIKLDFTSPILTSGSAITRYIDNEDGSEYIYSLFVPSDASTAFPVFDQPDLKARFQLELKTPSDWESVTNTRVLTGSRSGNEKTSSFEETKPISTYLFAFAAGRFEVVTKAFPLDLYGIGGGGSGKEYEEAMQRLREEPRGAIYVRRSQYRKLKPHVTEVFGLTKLTKEAIKYLEEYFDYKFPWPKYDIVLIPEFPFGGMEHAGATFLRETGVIFPSEPTANEYISRANLIFHETAHKGLATR